MGSDDIQVEICYARPDVQVVVALTVAAGTTAHDAVRQSRLAQRFAELADGNQPLGLYGKRVEGSRVLKDGDRVEILRPLSTDPKDARRKRAGQGGSRKS